MLYYFKKLRRKGKIMTTMVTIPIPKNFPQQLVHPTLVKMENICKHYFKDNHQELYRWMFKIVWDDATQEFHWDLLQEMLDRYLGKWDTIQVFKVKRQLSYRLPLTVVNCGNHVHIFNGYNCSHRTDFSGRSRPLPLESLL